MHEYMLIRQRVGARSADYMVITFPLGNTSGASTYTCLALTPGLIKKHKLMIPRVICLKGIEVGYTATCFRASDISKTLR